MMSCLIILSKYQKLWGLKFKIFVTLTNKNFPAVLEYQAFYWILYTGLFGEGGGYILHQHRFGHGLRLLEGGQPGENTRLSFSQCCGSMTVWGGSGSADPCLWLVNSDPDPAIFVIDLQDASKKLFFCLLLFKATFT
jgi:hypothetical protein